MVRAKWHFSFLVPYPFYTLPSSKVRGNPCTLKFGDFGPARKEVAEATGADNYNLERTIAKVIKTYGVINESGTEVTSWGFTNELEVMRWMSPKELQKLRDKRDDFNAPRYSLNAYSTRLNGGD